MEDQTWLKALDKKVTHSLRIALEVFGDTKSPVTNELKIVTAIRVMYKVKHPFEKMAALLYDTKLTEFTMYNLCIPSKVIDAILALNPKPNESYQNYLIRIKKLKVPCAVLIAILTVNIENYLSDSTCNCGYQLYDAQTALKFLK